MTSRIEVIEWFNRKIPEYRIGYLEGFSGHTRKKVMKEYQVLTDKFLKIAKSSYGYPFKWMLRWKFDELWMACDYVIADSDMTDIQIRSYNTVSEIGTSLLREFDRAFGIGRCK